MHARGKKPQARGVIAYRMAGLMITRGEEVSYYLGEPAGLVAIARRSGADWPNKLLPHGVDRAAVKEWRAIIGALTPWYTWTLLPGVLLIHEAGDRTAVFEADRQAVLDFLFDLGLNPGSFLPGLSRRNNALTYRLPAVRKERSRWLKKAAVGGGS